MPNLRLVAAAAAVVVALPSTAGAAQLDADEAPARKGPVATSSQLKSCQSEPVKKKGQTIARFRVCSRYYLFDPESESDTDTDYGAYWFQVNGNAVPGYCIKSLRTDLEYSGHVHAKAPKSGTRVHADQKRRHTTKLVVDAQGNAETNGILKNSFVLHPGTMTARGVGGDVYRLRWSGSSGGRLGFAAGLELSWATGTDAPDVHPEIVARLSQDC